MNKVELGNLKIGMEVKVKKTGEMLVVTGIDSNVEKDVKCGNEEFKHSLLEFLGTYPETTKMKSLGKENSVNNTEKILIENKDNESEDFIRIGRVKLKESTLDELPKDFKAPKFSKAVSKNKNGFIPKFYSKLENERKIVEAVTEDRSVVKFYTKNVVSAKRAWNAYVKLL